MPTRLLTFALLLALAAVTVATAATAPDQDRLRTAEARASYANWADQQHNAVPTPAPQIDNIVPIDEAELLVIFDAPLVDVIADQVMAICDDLDYDIAWWNVQLDGDVTWDMLNHDFAAVLLFSDNTGILPTRTYDDSNPFVQYLMNGGHLFYGDQDYFWGNSEVSEPVFNPGDLAYDAFGIASGENDTNSNEDFYLGVEDDPITGAWATETFITNPMLTFNWEDNVTGVPDADVCFSGATYGHPTGLVYENSWGGTSIHLSFNALAAADGDWGGFTMSGQFITLLDNLCDYYTGGMIQPVDLDLTPTNTLIPPSGGTMTYDIHFETTVNLTVPGVTFWTMVTMPNGQVFGPLLQQTFTVTPFMDVNLIGMSLQVPGIAPSGEYTFTGNVGMFPNVYIHDDFQFEKLGTVAGDGNVGGWIYNASSPIR